MPLGTGDLAVMDGGPLVPRGMKREKLSEQHAVKCQRKATGFILNGIFETGTISGNLGAQTS